MCICAETAKAAGVSYEADKGMGHDHGSLGLAGEGGGPCGVLLCLVDMPLVILRGPQSAVTRKPLLAGTSERHDYSPPKHGAGYVSRPIGARVLR